MVYLRLSNSTMSTTSTTQPIRGCMKVTTLNDSLASCRRSRRSSLGILSSSRGRVSAVDHNRDNRNLDSLGSEKFYLSNSQKERGVARRDVRRSKSDNNLQQVTRSQRFVNRLKDSIEPRRKKKEEIPVKRRSSVFATMKHLGHMIFHEHDLDKTRKENDGKDEKCESSVKFLDVDVRVYEVIASDNPSVSSGAAIGLGWKYSILDSENIEEFERKRAMERSNDFLREKRLAFTERRRILHEFGVTDKEIMDATKHAAAIRSRRAKSVKQMSYDKMFYYMEAGVDTVWGGTKRSFGRFILMNRSKSSVDVRLHPSLFTPSPE